MKRLNLTISYHSQYLIFPILIVLVYVILYKFPYGFIPDLLSLSNNHNVSSYLATIISSVSSLTGLLIVILVIAFEYYKSNLNKIYLKYFVSNRSLVTLVNFYIFVFTFSCLSLLLLKSSSPTSNGELTVCYVSLFAFLFLIPVTFIVSYRLVKSLNINDIVDEYLNKLSFDNIFLLNVNNEIFPAKEEQLNQSSITKIVDSDYLAILQKLVINQLESDNSVKAQIILNKISNKFSEYILEKEEDEIKTKTNFHQFRYANFLLSVVSESKANAKINSELIFDKILGLIEGFFFSYHKKGYKNSYIEPFRESTYTKLFRFNQKNEILLEKLIKSVKKIIENKIDKNLPDEHQIMIYDPEYRKEHNIEFPNDRKKLDYEIESSWNKFVENYPNYFIEQINSAINNRSEKKLLNLLSLYSKSIFSIYWKPSKANKHLKFRWIIHNFLHLIELYRDAIERNIPHQIRGYHIITDSDITDMFKNNDVGARRILVEYLQFVLWLSKRQKLSYSIFCGIYSMGNLGSMFIGPNLTKLGCFFVENHHLDKRYKEGYDDVLNTIKFIYEDYTEGTRSKEVTFKTMLLVIEKIKAIYLNSRNKKSKSQKVLRSLNRLKKDIEVTASKEES